MIKFLRFTKHTFLRIPTQQNSTLDIYLCVRVHYVVYEKTSHQRRHVNTLIITLLCVHCWAYSPFVCVCVCVLCYNKLRNASTNAPSASAKRTMQSLINITAMHRWCPQLKVYTSLIQA